ncbi:MAG: type II secretion system F family protein [Tepidimonas sp.]|uniref:type II secretion system F family protein n=1 Tax=Tepidimonas sp. TaxID=2002775 RepID=UPI004054D4FF
MPRFRYRAVDALGKVVIGEAEALHTLDLREQLRHGGLTLIGAKAARQAGRTRRIARLQARERVDFLYYLQIMLRAGVTVLDALEDLRGSSDSATIRQVAGVMRERIAQGLTLAQAVDAMPEHFGPVVASLIRAGEVTGQLPEVLDRLVASLKWQLELAAQTKKALMYPAFVAVTVSAVVVFLMTYLVPQLVGFITNMGQEIPIHTRALIAVSNAFVHYWWAIFGAPIVVVAATLAAAARIEPLRYALHHALLRTPVVGSVLLKIWLARMLDTFALMYRTGVAVIDGMRYSAEVTTNLPLKRAMLRARDRVVEGQGISAAFAQEEWFPSIVVRMLRVGENTGAIDEALEHVTYYLNRDVQDTVGRMQAIIEPVLNVTMGVILGWIMMAVLGPIYDTITKIVK